MRPREVTSAVTAVESKQGKGRASTMGSVLEEIRRKQKEGPEERTMKFLEKISDETYLIGTEDQLDLVCIHGVSKNYLETGTNWSLCLQQPIRHLAIDPNSKQQSRQSH